MGWMDGRMDGWMGAWVDGWPAIWLAGCHWVHGRAYTHTHLDAHTHGHTHMHARTHARTHTHAHLWWAIEAADQVGRDVVLPRKHGAAEIAQLDLVVALVDEDVVGLDVRVQHPARWGVGVVWGGVWGVVWGSLGVGRCRATVPPRRC